uniref:Uncharacterized protein n=1 Tax=Anguilla anguilla TaxID=7936 RepID=A0A0E9UDX9_ANGAN
MKETNERQNKTTAYLSHIKTNQSQRHS